MSLLNSNYFTLFAIISIGIIIGKIKIKGVSLDNSAVLFVALIFGHYGFTIPKDFQKIGLLLFVFTIGIQNGPGFFKSFKKNGSDLIIIVSTLAVTALITTVSLSYFFELDFKLAVGLFTGALTSTPGLAAAIEATKSPLASIGYGVAYPFGVIGVLLFVKILPIIFRQKISDAEEDIKLKKSKDYPQILSRHFVVENPNVHERTLKELNVPEMTGANISRVQHDNNVQVPDSKTVLLKHDIIKAVGTETSLQQVQLLIGPETKEILPLSKKDHVQWVLITNRSVINKSLGQLNLPSNYNATVTRIQRSGIEIPPGSNSELRFGDKLMIATSKENMKSVIKLLGNENKRLSNTDFLPIAAGIVIGVILGQVKIPLYNGLSFSPGLTGGVLITALFLSSKGKTGPIIWTMSGSANQLLRKFGLLLFLATVGSHAGLTLLETMSEYGSKLFLISSLITIIPMLVSTMVAKIFLNINVLSLIGALTGGMTSTPGLSAADSMTSSNEPHIAYAAVYPISLVMMIVCAQIISNIR